VKVSIAVINHNYGRFLRAALDSALRQTHPDVEVVVVDDGSTDGSRSIIEGYAPRVRAVLQPNLGQAAAVNAGFAASAGDLVIFLDADDQLYPNAVEKAVAAWRPEVSVVQYCLATIDAEGRPLGAVYPPLPDDWTPERVRATVRAAGLYPAPTTSGNAFSRALLERVMPLATDVFHRGAEGPINTVAPLYGDVVVLREPLGCYRIHGTNMGALESVDPAKFSYYVQLDINRAAFLREHAKQLGMPVPDDLLERAFFHLQYRVASLKLRPDLHPVPGDRLPVLAWRLTRAAVGAPDKPLLRIFVALWGWLVAAAPAGAARQFVGMRFIGQRRPPALDRLLHRLGLVRRTGRPAASIVAGK